MKLLLYITIVVILISSCVKPGKDEDIKVKQRFSTVDSLIIAGRGDSAMAMLENLRHQIKATDPFICEYYRIEAEHNIYNVPLMTRYIDSALAFFNNKVNPKKYPDEYLKILLVKGDACMRLKQFNQALDYYDQCKKLLASGSCDDGMLAAKIAGIYYSQKNYKIAAKYWVENYRRIGSCNESVSAQKFFVMKQGALNNAGVAYEKDGQLDSAEYYYLEDLKLINKADHDNILDKYYIRTSSAVVFDNLGGLNLKRGNLIAAADYLKKCLSLPVPDVDGLHIPPYIKLAELNVITGNYTQAADAFGKARRLLDTFGKQSTDLEIRWYKDYAQYLVKIKQTDKAYAYLETSIRLKDSTENQSSKIYKLDVERELNSLHQKQALTELKQQDKLKQTYLVGITIAVILSLVIIVLITRNLKKSRSNHRRSMVYTKHLQTTLTELERANKNYIRIMRVMAHDLRNPLWGITGLASMLLDEDDFSEDNRHMIRLIESTGTHTMEMINELLKSGLADENEPISTEIINLKELLFDSVELLQFKAKEKKQLIEFAGDEKPIMAAANHEKMWRVFNNLIVNAIKFSHEGGIINVGIKQNNKQILVSVADHGIGIPAENKDGIFEMFTPNKRVGTGGEQPFGLGLSISKKIIEKHGGKIWFESRQSGGTIFYIQLNGV
ncbi:tetratricopeptide repeat-containing sensor histidine kinase [Mucilaginibacter pineti]|uniref:tetratricopeptide repeat-containing sensor histidine kinase n=1 Tax=Mucilaginibacter pineti TaxID=1391627 RepID=UPI000B824720|nr:ATP-binding protein [Mucilaginibacter pineti]